MSSRFIVCHGVPVYEDSSYHQLKDDPNCEFTLMVDNISRMTKMDDARFKTRLIYPDMLEEGVKALFLEETTEEIRKMINLITDTEMLDWLDKHAKYHGFKWDYKYSTSFKGWCYKLKLRESYSGKAEKLPIREVILGAMKHDANYGG